MKYLVEMFGIKNKRIKLKTGNILFGNIGSGADWDVAYMW